MMRRTLAILAFLPAIALAQTDKAAAEQSLKQIEAFTNLQARTDPHYLAVEDALLTEVDEIVTKSPPREWLPKIRERYTALSEAEHAKERDRVRADELAAARAPGASWESRYAELEALAKAGKLGARQHALHALEAALALAPDAPDLIAWRQVKLPLATSYEMGAISRPEYEDRWAKTTAYFLDRQSANDRARAQIGAALAAEEVRLNIQAIQARTAPRPLVRCRSTQTYGVTETRCF